MYSVVLDGKVLDFKYKKFEYGYTFYIGDILIGRCFKKSKTNWSAVSMMKPSKVVNGFNSRFSASDYLLEINIYNEEVDKKPVLINYDIS